MIEKEGFNVCFVICFQQQQTAFCLFQVIQEKILYVSARQLLLNKCCQIMNITYFEVKLMMETVKKACKERLKPICFRR